MTDIVEEARAMLAQATPGPWNDGITEIDAGLHGCTSVVEATCNPTKWGGCGGCELRISKPDRALIAAAPRLLTALADECERLSTALDAMTNQAVMASGRRATIVTEDGELERLRAENARLREAMPSEVVEKDIDYLLSCINGHPNVADKYERVSEWLARLDAAKEGR